MNVLITSASRKVGLVRAFMEAVRTTGGGRVVAADITPLAPALYEADTGILIPRSDDPGFVDAVLAICERDGIGLVVPTRDEELPVFAAAKERFAANGISVLVARCRCDRDLPGQAAFRRRVRGGRPDHATGDRVTRRRRTCRCSSGPAAARAGWARAQCGRKPSSRSRSTNSAQEAFSQELVVGPEFTIDVFVDSSGVPISACLASGCSWSPGSRTSGARSVTNRSSRRRS